MDSVRSERAERLARALATVELAADATRANRPKPVNVATLRHWEQGDRRPRGPALVLLNVIARNHRAVMQALK